MIEKIVLDHLTGILTVPVHMETPSPDAGVFCVVEKSGSGERNQIYDALVIVRSYANSLYKAAELNEEVKAAMKSLDEHDEVTDCLLNTDYAYQDPTTGRYRYQAVFNINHY